MGTDIHGIFQAKKDGEWVDVPSEYDQSRHYLLFAWLGNVRNGHGFAGIFTHNPIVPLSDGRGFPDDFIINGEEHPVLSIDVMDKNRRNYREENDPLEIWMGDHSYSWVSSEEVINTPLPKIIRTGIIGIDEYNGWDGETAPGKWCDGIAGPGIHVSDTESIEEKTTHVKISWAEDTSESLSYFVDEVRRLAETYGEVRFVFGFDS